ncbi:MAG TPA: DUF6375 family protein [bacterium]|nr:DUF6375 family protein [bacterium]
MQVWRSYGSAHSADINIVGSFATVADAERAHELLADFLRTAFAATNGKSPDDTDLQPVLSNFYERWKEKDPFIVYHGPSLEEFEGIGWGDDGAAMPEKEGTQVSLRHIRTMDIGGIVKLMLVREAKDVAITGRRGP